MRLLLSAIWLLLLVTTLFAGSYDNHGQNDLLFDKQNIFPEDQILYQECGFIVNNSICSLSRQCIWKRKYSTSHNTINENRHQYRDLIWMNQVRVFYTYDANNNRLSSQRQFWSDSIWINNDQSIYSYDANNNNISSLYQTWNDSAWINGYQYNYTYDINNNQIFALMEIWGGTSWENQRQDNYSYDSTNNRIGHLAMNWDGAEWVNWFEIIYSYDTNNNMTLLLWQDWDGIEWVNNTQTITTFDASNNWIGILWQNWENTNWVNNRQNFATYDTNNNQIENLSQTWDETSWVNNNLWISTFDINNNPITYLQQHWDGANWANIQQRSIVYDANSNQIEFLHQNWDGNSWVNDWRAFKNYDNNDNQLDLLNQYWDGNDWVNDYQWFFTYDANNNRTLLISQTWVNTTPIINPISDQEIDEDQTLILQLSAETDLVNASLSFSAYNDTSSVLLAVDGTTLAITPQNNWSGNSQIVVIVLDNNYMESDTTNFNLIVTPVNDPPTIIDIIYPTDQDTFSTHIDNDTIITFNWSGGDIDSDIVYDLTISLEFFGNVYVAEYTDIPDTFFELQSNELDQLLAGLGYNESELMWYLETTDGEFVVNSDTGSFYLTRGLLDILNVSFVPKDFILHQNYPNPFNPITTLRYDLPENSFVNIIIYDMLGRQVRTLVNKTQDAGYKSVIWNATNDNGKPVSAGVYLYQIRAHKKEGGQADEYVQTKKMVLLK